MLTIETKVYGDSRSTNERGSSLVGSFGSLHSTSDFCLLIWVSGYERQKREGKTSEIKTGEKILELQFFARG